MMLIASLFAAAALAKLEPAVESDVRCVVAMLYLTGKASEEKDADGVRAFSAASSYYLGKLAVRAPTLKLPPHIDRLAESDEFLENIDKETARCSEEAGKAMQRINDD